MSRRLRTTFYAILAAAVSLYAQTAPRADDALVDVVLFGVHMPIVPGSYDPPLRAEVERFVERASSHLTSRPPAQDGLERMVRTAQEGWERRLVGAASSGDPSDVAREAETYVTELRPCYEWEGMSDCPLREATFADSYAARHPDTRFQPYLTLLAAHRWLCAGEFQEFEGDAAAAAVSMKLFEQRLAVARQVPDLLVAAVAERLAQRRSCRTTREGK